MKMLCIVDAKNSCSKICCLQCNMGNVTLRIIYACSMCGCAYMHIDIHKCMYACIHMRGGNHKSKHDPSIYIYLLGNH